MKPLFLCVMLLFCNLLMGQKQEERINLDDNWSFSQAGQENWLSAKVPGTVHQDLIRHQLLPDPFYGKNEEKIQWVEEKDWEYKTNFTVTAEQLERDVALLIFEGLDTYADVYLNGACILRADNMFVGHRLPVKELLRVGENRLHIYFHSPIQKVLPQWRSNGFDYPADNDHRKEKLSVFTRKAPYHYGWDWGIRMVTSGIWRPISLVFQDVVTIEECYVRQESLADELAKLSVELELQKWTANDEEFLVQVEWHLPNGEKGEVERDIQLEKDGAEFAIPVEIAKPKRWMPNGWGEPTLYDFEIRISKDGQLLAVEKQRIGLRTVEVVKEKDKDGEAFYFVVNGIPMFAKGANYVPSDISLPAVTEKRYRTLFKDIQTANMNMIRVWGGGVYEDDLFYDLADEHGILVWQDFMFACSSYPHDADFLARVEKEASYNIRRLRHHACLAMWCGNNEILEGMKYWGWKRRFTPEVYAGMEKGYKMLFEELLPMMVKQWDDGRFYMHGSPYSSNWGRPESWKFVDTHNWGVWLGKKPFTCFDSEVPRFMSEFGFQAFPPMKTIATFAAPEDYDIESEVMNSHQKSSVGNGLIRTYMERDYRVPERFEDFIYVGMVMQGFGIRQGLETHRRHRPYCMGSLYWQLNDNWPVVSWSGIDYYGNWKALHYQAKRAFAPLAVNLFQKEKEFEIWLLSDLLQEKKSLTLELQWCDFSGKVEKKAKYTVAAPANSSTKVLEHSLDEWFAPDQQQKGYLLVTLRDQKGQKISEEPHFFSLPGRLELPACKVDARVKIKDGVCELTLKSDVLAKDLYIEVPIQGARFSDNFFDLLPKTSRKITITSPEIRAGEPLKVEIKHLQSTYK